MQHLMVAQHPPNRQLLLQRLLQLLLVHPSLTPIHSPSSSHIRHPLHKQVHRINNPLPTTTSQLDPTIRLILKATCLARNYS